MRSIIVAAMVVAGIGCAHSRARVPAERICRPEAGSAMLCLARLSGTAQFVAIEVLLDGRLINVYDNEFSEIALAPGDHILRISPPEGLKQEPERVEFTVREGEVKAFEIAMTRFMDVVDMELRALEPDAARARIAELDLLRAAEQPPNR